VGVERRDLAVGVGGVVGDVELDLAVEWGAVRLAPSDQRLLVGEAGTVPELHEHADHPHDVVAAADRPARLAVAVGDPHVAIEHGVVGGQVGGAVDEPHQVAHAGPARALRAAGGTDVMGRVGAPVVAVDHPREDEVATGGPHQLAQGEEVEVLVVAADRQQHVAVRAGRVELVVGQERHRDELGGEAVGEAEALVEQAGADGHDHGEVGGRRRVADGAGVQRRVGRAAVLVRFALHQPSALARQGLEELDELRPVAAGDGQRGE